MITLQNIIAPENEICSEEALYCHRHGTVGFSQSSGQYHLPVGSRLSFGAYFNLFNLQKWGSACALKTLFLEVYGNGCIELRVIHALPGRSWETAYSEVQTLTNQTPVSIDLSAFAQDNQDGVLFLEILAIGQAVTFDKARFATQDAPARLPELAVSITTFKREQDVERTVQRLEAFLETFHYGTHIHVQVVDNGQSADIPENERVTPYPNRNLGGAGGFARGLMEAEKSGYSHCLFMDDDASFHMENIARAYTFLALSKIPEAALAGAMINNTHKWRMWENGAYFDGSCKPLFNGTDLREQSQVVNMEFTSTRHRPATLYGGWWFFAFPIAHVTRYPFPFFVRGDDISFSIANRFQIFTLNGVVSFQDDFTEKESPQTLYLDLRNHLMHHLVFDSLSRSAFGTAKIALRFMARSLLRCKYESAEAQLLSWQDLMQGPDFFDEHIDMSKRRADIKALMKNENWVDLSQLDLSEKRRFSRLPRRLRHYMGVFTLNGHLVPFWSKIGDKMVLPISERGLVFPAFGGADMVFLNTARTKGYRVVHSKTRFFSLCWRILKTLVEFCRNHDALKAKYRKGYAEMASKTYWDKTLR